MDEKEITRLLSQDLSEGTEAFRDALLARCLDALDAESQSQELDDDQLELLAAAGDVLLRAPDVFGDNTPNDN